MHKVYAVYLIGSFSVIGCYAASSDQKMAAPSAQAHDLSALREAFEHELMVRACRTDKKEESKLTTSPLKKSQSAENLLEAFRIGNDNSAYRIFYQRDEETKKECLVKRKEPTGKFIRGKVLTLEDGQEIGESPTYTGDWREICDQSMGSSIGSELDELKELQGNIKKVQCSVGGVSRTLKNHYFVAIGDEIRRRHEERQSEIARMISAAHHNGHAISQQGAEAQVDRGLRAEGCYPNMPWPRKPLLSDSEEDNPEEDNL